MIEPFDPDKSLDSKNYIYNEINLKKEYTFWKILILVSSSIIASIILGIIIIKLSISEYNKNKIEIDCEYRIENLNEINLLSESFKKITNISIYIGNDLIDYNYIYKFNTDGTHKVKYIINKKLNMENMFNNITNLISVNITTKKEGNLYKSLSKAFSNCTKLENFYSDINPGNTKNYSYMFSNCTSLSTVIFKNFGSSANNLSHMFENCTNLTNLILNKSNTNNVQDMSYMFFNCTKLDLYKEKIVEKFNTSSVQNMSNIFSHCTNLTSLNLTNFNTTNVKDFSSMFENCHNLIDLNLLNFKTNNALNMFSMFKNCTKLNNINFESFDTSLISNMSYMFSNCTTINILNISSFNFSLVEDMSFMFANCTSLNKLINNSLFIPNNNAKVDSMFKNCNDSIIPDWYNKTFY